MSLATGEIIDGKYRILRMLGQGGMGAVYEGENVRIRRRVAIKVLHPAVSAQEESVRRFKREAQAAAQIGSDHICEVLDLGVLPDGTHYMVMEYLEGDTLGARLKHTGRFPPERIIPILSQSLDALGAAHAAGIIHRDLKPDNIFIVLHKAGIHDFVKILDFGVSKFSQLSGEEMNMTRQGAVVGTPYYMSPEQARGGQVDQRSDIYALGVLLFQAITGQVPFQATTFNELLFKIVLEPAPPPRQFVPDLDPDFAAIIQRAMARDPAHRFQSCMEFKDALLAWLAARPMLTSGSPMLQAALAQRQPKTQALPAMPAPPTGPLAVTPQPVPSPLSPHLTPSGNAWATASHPSGLPVPQTANSWADASGTSAPARPPSRAPVIAIAVATVLLVGGGAGAWVMLSRGGPAAGGPAETQSAAPVETEAPSAAPPDTGAPADSAAPVDTAAPVDSSEPIEILEPEVSVTPTATPAPTPPPWRPPGGPIHKQPPTKPTQTTKTGPTTSPKDPGY